MKKIIILILPLLLASNCTFGMCKKYHTQQFLKKIEKIKNDWKNFNFSHLLEDIERKIENCCPEKKTDDCLKKAKSYCSIFLLPMQISQIPYHLEKPAQIQKMIKKQQRKRRKRILEDV